MAAVIGKRRAPRLMACMTKASLENVRNKALFSVAFLDEKQVRRNQMPLYECVQLELRESGYIDSAEYFQDLMYDNQQLMAEDEIGVIVDIRKNDEYVTEIAEGLKMAEKAKEKRDTKQESIHLLTLAQAFAERGKGIIWLAEKFYLAAVAVASQYLVDGGRQKAVCKYHYASFLLDKFPTADPDEAFNIMSKVRDFSNGRKWTLYEAEPEACEDEELPTMTVFVAAALQLHRILLDKVRQMRRTDPHQAERLCRIAVRRAVDAQDTAKEAEAIIEMGICQMVIKNLKNAFKTFHRALDMYEAMNDIKGVCDAKMNLADVLQREGDHKKAAETLTEMGSLAMNHGLRKQLGRALHLLGELHLRRGHPELGTQHLAEAFSCFMGFSFHHEAIQIRSLDDGAEEGGMQPVTDVSKEEAEQSRLMMAVSAGQELMASYFHEILESRECYVSRHKIIEWKLTESGWWIDHNHHNYFICPCPKHQRTIVDVIKYRAKVAEEMEAARLAEEESYAVTIQDIRKLCTSFQKFKSRVTMNEAAEKA